VFHYAILINTFAVLIGSFAGIGLKRNIAERYREILFLAVGLLTLGIGTKMALKSEEFLVVLGSLAVGGLIGEWMDIEGKLGRFANLVEKSQGETLFVKGFISASVLFLVGPMTIIGSVNIGTVGKADLILIKSLMDGISSVVLGSIYGLGVTLSAVSVFIVQGLLVIFAGQLSFLSQPVFLNDFTGVGGLMILGIGIRMLKLRELKIGNFLPALVVVVLLDWVRLAVMGG